MTVLRRHVVVLALRTYAVAALIGIVFVSPSVVSVIPILLATAYLFLIWRAANTLVPVLMDFFFFFAVCILLTQTLSPWLSLTLALPLLALVTVDLQSNASSVLPRTSVQRRGPTAVGIGLVIITGLTMFVGLFLDNVALRLTSLTALAYLTALVVIVIRKIPSMPVTIGQTAYRIVAGTHDSVPVTITINTKYGSMLSLRTSDEWVKIRDPDMLLKGGILATEIGITPSLSGPSSVTLQCHLVDRWGLTCTNFSLDVLSLNVIPRARYAAWLAKKYLAESKAGTLPLVSTVAARKPLSGMRRGSEYYGSQLYQPGDSLKNIDWKHSIKYNKLISKEFVEFQGQEAILLINLVVGNAEEADKQAYNMITVAISLAREQIPAAIAAYDDADVVFVTGRLPPQQLVMQTMDVAERIVTVANPRRYLGRPDIQRLRANVSRLRSSDGEASRVLSKLLQIEYDSLKSTARLNPAAKASTQAEGKMGQQACLVIVSQANHDAETLDFLHYSRIVKGDSVVVI